jgi:hypothetical protein
VPALLGAADVRAAAAEVGVVGHLPVLQWGARHQQTRLLLLLLAEGWKTQVDHQMPLLLLLMPAHKTELAHHLHQAAAAVLAVLQLQLNLLLRLQPCWLLRHPRALWLLPLRQHCAAHRAQLQWLSPRRRLCLPVGMPELA